MSEDDRYVSTSDAGMPPSTGAEFTDQPPGPWQIQQMVYRGDVLLGDGSPVWHALLHPDEAGVVDTLDSQTARAEFDLVLMNNPFVVWACRDQTSERAAQILNEALSGPAVD